jgi:EAL domain-containing protein (putative c-di-GMP-specific phosphodiesterase class I)
LKFGILEGSDGKLILRKACSDAASWSSPTPVHVAVNLSPIQFKRRTLVEAVIKALAVIRLGTGAART